MSVDWIKVYAEARVAFPPDVSLHTEPGERGGVKVTAYRREFDPPLPSWIDPQAASSGGAAIAYASEGEGENGDLIVHVERVRGISYVILDERDAAQMTAHAARRWRHAAAKRGQA
jgi:hypothetical protein